MRVEQRAIVLRLRHHEAVAHLPLPSHHLRRGGKHGVTAPPQALFRPPPPLQMVGFRVPNGLHLVNLSRHRIHGPLTHHYPHASLMRTRHQHRRLGRGTDAKGTEGGPNLQVVHLPSATIDQLGDPVLPLHRLEIFSLSKEDSQLMLIRPGETQSPKHKRPLPAKNLRLLHLILTQPHPARPSMPI